MLFAIQELYDDSLYNKPFGYLLLDLLKESSCKNATFIADVLAMRL